MTTFSLPWREQAVSILRARARINIWDGSVRSGKTIGSLIAWLDFVRHAPPGDLMMIGRTERTLRRNVLYPLRELVGRRNFTLNIGAGEAYIFGRRVFIVGASDERAAERIQGVTLAGAYGDELATWPESAMTMLLTRLSVEGARFFGTTNPESPLHWLKLNYIDKQDGQDVRVFHFKLENNPTLSREYIEAQKRLHQGLFYRRYILGEWAAAEGAIFDMFDADKHCVDVLPKLSRTWIGVDYGTTNPTVYLPYSLGNDGVFYVHHEYRWDSKAKGRQKTDADYSKDFRNHMQRPPHEAGCGDRHGRNSICGVESIRWERVLSDPSAASFNLQLWRDGVLHVTPADNAVLEGVRNVATLLGAGLLKFHRPTTLKTVEEMVSYAWDPKAQERGEDKPLKMQDHGPDALRYVVRGTRHVWRRMLPAGLVSAREAA